jgi:transposase
VAGRTGPGQPYAGKVAWLRKLTPELAAVMAGPPAYHDGYHAMQVLPGIGPVLAAAIIAEIGGIRRFCARPGCAAGLHAHVQPARFLRVSARISLCTADKA